MTQLTNIKPLSETKFLNMYELEYQLDNNETTNYLVTSRNKITETSDLTTQKPAAVHIFAVDETNERMLLVKEFRYATGHHVYGGPAGLIDGDETPEVAAQRELIEETGYTGIHVTEVMPATYSSAGMTNEMAVPLVAVVDSQTNIGQHLDGHEDISYGWYTRDEVSELMKTEAFDARTGMAAKMFIANVLVSEKDLEVANAKFFDDAFDSIKQAEEFGYTL